MALFLKYFKQKGKVLLSEVFEISIDNLIKGDLEQMKKEINLE